VTEAQIRGVAACRRDPVRGRPFAEHAGETAGFRVGQDVRSFAAAHPAFVDVEGQHPRPRTPAKDPVLGGRLKATAPFRETLARDMNNYIAYLKSRVLQRRGGPVGRPGQRPHERVAARLQDAQALRHALGQPVDEVVAPLERVKPQRHERDGRRRVGNDGVNAAVRHARQHLKRVPQV
jgi:hypothetical protein